MDILLTAQSIGISELRESPTRAFEQAGDSAVVVLNHNRPAVTLFRPRVQQVKKRSTQPSRTATMIASYTRIYDHSPIGNQS